MLGYLSTGERGRTDRLIAAAAARLIAEGLPLAGAVQHNTETGAGLPCDMDLAILPGGRRVRISQRLGGGATGCRLDPQGLEEAVGLTSAAFAASGARLLVVNRFGREEAAGRGFRHLIGAAAADGLPVLVGVSPEVLDAFEAFGGGLARRLPDDLAAVLAWCRGAAG